MMDCLVLPVSMLIRRPSMSRHGYRKLHGDGGEEAEAPVRVVVGKEKREFLVEPFVLEESPFRVLMEAASARPRKEDRRGRLGEEGERRAVFVDVDSILFEHMLWLMYNDCSSLFRLNLEEIIDFYAHDF